MPFTTPPPKRPRRRGQPAARPIRRENSNIHSTKESEATDFLASLSIDLSAPIDVTEELLTIADLLTFAAPTNFTTDAPLLAGSFTTTSDSSYVLEAQKGSSSNPARSDLNGLAPNAYQLGIDVAAAFSIKPSSIGGRAYRPYRSDHTTGHARDIPGSGERGQAIADWVVARASTYKVKYIIFNYRIWYPGKGWQVYNPSSSVRGFASDAGHVRHVHVSVY